MTTTKGKSEQKLRRLPVLFFYFIFISSLIPFFMILSNQITKRNKVSLAENFQRKGKKLLYHYSKDFILNILHMYQNFNPKAKKQLNISSIQNDTSDQRAKLPFWKRFHFVQSKAFSKNIVIQHSKVYNLSIFEVLIDSKSR